MYIKIIISFLWLFYFERLPFATKVLCFQSRFPVLMWHLIEIKRCFRVLLEWILFSSFAKEYYYQLKYLSNKLQWCIFCADWFILSVIDFCHVRKIQFEHLYRVNILGSCNVYMILHVICFNVLWLILNVFCVVSCPVKNIVSTSDHLPDNGFY